jgi:hypothetical protein
MAEVFRALEQLGLRACPVCGSAESLRCGHLLLFNAQRFRTGDEKIMEYGVVTN